MEKPSKNSRIQIKSDTKDPRVRLALDLAQRNGTKEMKYRPENNVQNDSWRTRG